MNPRYFYRTIINNSIENIRELLKHFEIGNDDALLALDEFENKLAASDANYDYPFGPYPTINYKEYIKSEYWKERATNAKQSAGWRCQLCNKGGDNATLHAHHKTYERLGYEYPEDLIILCADCHAKFHDKEFENG